MLGYSKTRERSEAILKLEREVKLVYLSSSLSWSLFTRVSLKVVI